MPHRSVYCESDKTVFLIAVIFALLSIQALPSEAALLCHHKRIYLLPAIVGKIAFRTPGAHGQDEDLGTMVFVLHRVANLSRFMTAISRNRTHQGYSPEGFCQECFKALFYHSSSELQSQILWCELLFEPYIYIITNFFWKIKFSSLCRAWEKKFLHSYG